MRHTLRLCRTLCLSTCLVLGIIPPTLAQNITRAKIGIHIHHGDGVRWAKAAERVNAGDTFRIFVVPKEPAYVYMVHFNDQVATPLVPEALVAPETTLVFPPNDAWHPFHGTGQKESITIVSSPKRLVNIWRLLLASQNMPYAQWYAKWMDTEKQLIEQSTIDLSESAEETASYKQIHIGGTVRALPNQQNTAGDTLQYTIQHNQTSSCGASVTFRTTNLPAGLSLDPSTGTITGTIRSDAAAHSPYSVTVTLMTEQHKPCWEGGFTWNVQDKPFAKELQELRIFSGKSLVVKHYEFTVKK